ncbi:MAG: NADH-ubiquinone oxidoreductase-F iron-sulfur binding region domain-containing protein [Bacteroidales bacterium]
MTTEPDNIAMQSMITEFVENSPSDYSEELKVLTEKLKRNILERPLIMVGLNTSGTIAGAGKVYEAVVTYLADRHIDAELSETGAIGIGSEEPILGIQLPGRTRVLFTNVDPSDVQIILDDVFHHTLPEEKLLGQIRNDTLEPWKGIRFIDELSFFGKQTRILLRDNGIIDPFSIDEYMARGGYRTFLRTIRYHTFYEICVLVEESGLRGRSGSGFLTGKKWMNAQQASAEQKYLICNAEESDPGAFMDRALMEGNPHQLIEGICIAAYAIGATRAYIYIRSEYVDSIRKLSAAIKSARAAGILGHNIFYSGFNLDISIRKGPGAFVCGEETALIASMEGKRGMPQSKPPYPTERGFHKKPTVVNNVETLSNVPHIVANGADWFRSIGTRECPGTKIFSVSGRARNRGLIEIPMGTRLDLLVEEIIGGSRPGHKLKAVHIGGPYGSIIPADKMKIPICYETFTRHGAVLGAGGILLLDEKTCVVDLVKYFMGFMKHQSCGKCIPCREGTKRMSELLDEITRKPQDEDQHDSLEKFRALIRLEKLAEVMRDTSLCGLGQLAANPLMSSIRHFREEFEAHIFDRHCKPNVCRELRTYYIDVELCTGCSICARRCPEAAIIGTEKHPFFIVSDKCTGCGLCREVCKFSAVFYN